ncbi:MAG: PKD domain-containing protein [Bacteroidetes bacterium]|nr:MAG: PKD domain-containing protein [Bacteroidota bacterium]
MKKLLLVVILIAYSVVGLAKNLEFKSFQTLGDEPLRKIVELLDGSLLVAAKHGLFKSSDKGKSWDLIEFPSRDTIISDLKILKNGSVIILTDSCLFRSDDNAKTWIDINNGISRDSILFLYTEQNDNLIVTLLGKGYSNGGIFKSSNYGNNWVGIDNDTTIRHPIYSFTINTLNEYFIVTGGDVYRSKDNGKTWKHIKDTTDMYGISSVYCLNSDTVITLNNGYRYTMYNLIPPGSDTVEMISTFWYDFGPIYDMEKDSSGFIYIATNDGAFKFTFNPPRCDSVFYYEVTDNYGDPISDIHDIYFNSKNELLIVHRTGVYYSKNNGVDFELLFSASLKYYFDNDVSHRGCIIETSDGELMMKSSQGKLVKSQFDKRYWGIVKTGIQPTRTRGFPTQLITDKKGKIYVFYDSLGLYTSTDLGYSWVRTDSSTFNDCEIYTSLVDPTNRIFIGTNKGLFITSDDGKSWYSEPYFNNKNITAITQFSTDTFFIGADSILYISSDQGNTWKIFKNDFKNIYAITDIDFNSKKEIFISTGNGIFRYSNNKWEKTNKGIGDYDIYEMLITSNDELIISAYYNNIYFSNNNGEFWEHQGDEAERILLQGKNGKIYFSSYIYICYVDEISNDPIELPGWIDKGTYLEQKYNYSPNKFVRYSNDGKYLFTFDGYSHFITWDVESGYMVKDFYIQYYYYNFIDLMQDEKTLVLKPYESYYRDTSVYITLYDIEKDTIILRFDAKINYNDSINKNDLEIDYFNAYIMTDNKLLVKIDFSNIQQVSLWNLKTGKNINCINKFFPTFIKPINENIIAVGSISYKQNSDVLDTFIITLYDSNLSNPNIIYTELFDRGHYHDPPGWDPESKFVDMAYNSIDNTLYVSMWHKDLLVFSLDNFELVNSIPIRLMSSDYPINSILFLKNNNLVSEVYNFNRNNYIQFFDYKSYRICETYQFPGNDYKFSNSPNSFNVACGNNDGILWILKPRILNPEFQANFSTDTNFVIKNEPLQFYDISNGIPIWWVWDFGDGTGSDKQSPVHTYRKSGEFTVKLIASDGNKIDSIIKENYIVVKSPMWIDFTANPRIGYVPLEVQFYDKSIKDDYFYREWDFGDRHGSTDSNPSHKYYEAGIYCVTLTYDDWYFTKSLSDTIIVLDTITSVNEINKTFSASVFPNPANDFVIVSFSVEEPLSVNVTFSDILGNKVYNLEREYIERGFYTKKIDVNSLENGIYFLRISINGTDKTYKVTVLR